MAELVGTVAGEGGPFLIADRRAAESWTGSEGDFEQVFGLPPGGGIVRVGSTEGVAWEAEGAATAHVYRLGDEELLVQREWTTHVETPTVTPRADILGTIQIPSGGLVVLWSAIAWEDLYEPPSEGQVEMLSTLSMLDVGVQLSVPAGRYACWTGHTDDAYRCWIRWAT